MQAQKKQELSVIQLKRRQIAQLYLEIQENTQKLTHVLRYNPKLRKMPINWNNPIDLRSCLALIVQKTYLMYCCLVRKANILLRQQFFVKQVNKFQHLKSQEVFCEYILEIQYCHMTQKQQKLISNQFSITLSEKSFVQYVCEFILKFKNQLTPILQKTKNSPQQVYARQMEALCFIINNYLFPQRNQLSPKIFIQCLEQSEPFREFSKLLKTLNNSIFAATRFSSKNQVIYEQILKIQNNFLQKYSKNEPSQRSQRIQMSIEQSFKLLLKYNIISTQQSLSHTPTQQDSSLQLYTLGQIEGNNIQTRKYIIKIYVQEKPLRKFTNETINILKKQLSGSSQKLTKSKQQGAKLERSQYAIYFYCAKGLLCVKYITNIQLSIDNTDLLMFHCNSMPYDWNDVAIQFIDKNQGKSKKKDRCLAFKTVSYLHFHQKVVFKILAMIDLVMVYAKITEQHLRKHVLNPKDHFHTSNTLNLQCQHIRNMFIAKIQKTYQTLAESLSASPNDSTPNVT